MMRNETLFEAAKGLNDRVVGEVRTLEDWYSAEFERRLTELTEVLNSQLEARVEAVRKQFQEQYEALEQKASQAASMHTPAASVPFTVASTAASQGPPTELLEELTRNEASGQKIVSELERMVADDTVPLGKLLQLRNQELELKAYIRGLKFGIAAHTPAVNTPAKNTA